MTIDPSLSSKKRPRHAAMSRRGRFPYNASDYTLILHISLQPHSIRPLDGGKLAEIGELDPIDSDLVLTGWAVDHDLIACRRQKQMFAKR